MIRVVLDANVIASGISGIQNSASPPGELLRRWRKNMFVLITSEHVLLEVERTLRKPYFMKLQSAHQAAEIFATIRAYSVISPLIDIVNGVATHPEDDLVLATVASARANFLVTGDRQLQALRRFGATAIVSPAEFVAYLDQIGD